MKAAIIVPKEIDYAKVGLRVGFEIHQQLDTKTKLFCDCKTELASDDELAKAPRIIRRLRATKSELGEVDVAAAFEQQRGRVFEYIVPRGKACLVELDEEPPHPLNREALLISLAIAKALNARIVDEVHVMRKIVIDGSNTTGFQRTAIIAYNGYIEDKEGIVGIQTISLEEDAARKVEEREDRVIYALDRLGIPLIEISTAPDIKSPEQAKRVAEKIGLLMRLTGKVKRGIGTIRQDINLSIEGSPKIEIKGVQKLELIPRVIENEVRRLIGLKLIREELLRRGAKEEEILRQEPQDITELLKEKASGFVKKLLSKGQRAYVLKLPYFDGLLGVELQPNRRFGTELADYARQWAGVKGLIHSDELPNYGINRSLVEEIRKFLNANPEDAFVIIIDEPEKALKALNVVKNRAAEALKGIPKETRAANPDGTTRYMRPQPGAARMYPETDIPPVIITEELLKEAEKFMPPKPEDVLNRLVKEYGLSMELALQLLRSEYLQLFEELSKIYQSVDKKLIASIFTTILGELEKEGLDTTKLSDNSYMVLLEAIDKGVLPADKASIKEALKIIIDKNIRSLEELKNVYVEAKIAEEKAKQLIEEIISRYRDEIVKRGSKAFNFIMGKVMEQLRGKIEGKKVAEMVREILKNIVKE